MNLPPPPQNTITMSTTTPLIAPKNGKYVVCLPVEGKPYIRHISSPSVSKKKLEETVQGDAQKTGRTSIVIHPMFRENNKWNIAQKILDHPNTEVWVNRNGGEECSANMATCLTYRHPSGCPHMFGEVALIVSKAVLEKIVDPLTFQEEPDEDDEEEEIEEIERQEAERLAALNRAADWRAEGEKDDEDDEEEDDGWGISSKRKAEIIEEKTMKKSEMPLYDEEGRDIKCFWCNGRWCDNKVKDGVYVHKDCDEMCEACGCSSVEYELQDCYDGKHCLRCADEIIPETGKRRREM